MPQRTMVAEIVISELFRVGQHQLSINIGKESTNQKFQLSTQLVKLLGARYDDFLFLSLHNTYKAITKAVTVIKVLSWNAKFQRKSVRSIPPRPVRTKLTPTLAIQTTQRKALGIIQEVASVQMNLLVTAETNRSLSHRVSFLFPQKQTGFGQIQSTRLKIILRLPLSQDTPSADIHFRVPVDVYLEKGRINNSLHFYSAFQPKGSQLRETS